MRFKLRRGAAGFSLVEVVIATGAIATAAVLISGRMAQHFGAARHTEIKTEITDVRDYVRSHLSCQQTAQSSQSSCKSGGYVQIKQADGSNLIAIPKKKTYEIIGDNYALRGRCDKTNHNKLLVEVARLKKGKNEISADVLTGAHYDWTDLFDGIPVECPPTSLEPRANYTAKMTKTPSSKSKSKTPTTTKDYTEYDPKEPDVEIECPVQPPLTRNIVMVFDNSGSQKKNDPYKVRQLGARRFLNRFRVFANAHTDSPVYMSVVTFETNAKKVSSGWLQLNDATSGTIEQNIIAATSDPNGGTRYSPAFDLAGSLLGERGAAVANVDQRNYIIFLTDGLPNIEAMYAKKGIGETVDQINTSVNKVVTEAGAAVFGVAAGSTLPTSGEDMVKSISLPAAGITVADHVGAYTRADTVDKLDETWNFLFESLSKCKKTGG